MNAAMTQARIAVQDASDALAHARDALRLAASKTPQAASGLQALADAANEARRGFLADVAAPFDHGTLQSALALASGRGRRMSSGASHPLPFTI